MRHSKDWDLFPCNNKMLWLTHRDPLEKLSYTCLGVGYNSVYIEDMETLPLQSKIWRFQRPQEFNMRKRR
ncbi:hypothetical protein CR513_32423, partial [Mucuna pruriens]